MAFGVVSDKATLQGGLWILHDSGSHYHRGYRILRLIVQLHPSHDATASRKFLQVTQENQLELLN